ncbi:hypothetical protein ACFL6U_11000 [Planctomycetota bacterium]
MLTYPKLDVRRVFRVYPNYPAIGCDYYLRAGGDEVPDVEAKECTLQSLSLPGSHWRYRAVEFFDRTDSINTLVYESNRL